MAKQTPLIINIPHPCNQDWEKMTPDGAGRHCAHCQTRVIDFTNWSDAAMHRYFEEYKGKVCGRFLVSQTDRTISIPPQPHSRLYRMTIALGLTLLFTQGADLLAQSKPPYTTNWPSAKRTKSNEVKGTQYGEVKGLVTDEKKEPMINATVQIFQGGILKGGNVTDYDGNYTIKPLDTGIYDLLISYRGYDSLGRRKLVIAAGESIVQNFEMKRSEPVLDVQVIMGYKKGLVDPSPRHRKGIEAEEIRKLPAADNTPNNPEATEVPLKKIPAKSNRVSKKNR